MQQRKKNPAVLGTRGASDFVLAAEQNTSKTTKIFPLKQEGRLAAYIVTADLVVQAVAYA